MGKMIRCPHCGRKRKRDNIPCGCNGSGSLIQRVFNRLADALIFGVGGAVGGAILSIYFLSTVATVFWSVVGFILGAVYGERGLDHFGRFIDAHFRDHDRT